MTNKEAIGVIKFEIACVNRQDELCTRNCEKCDLCLPTENVLTAYDMAIKALEAQIDTKCSDPGVCLGDYHNKVNLCDSCKQTFPECMCTTEDVLFGDGKGDDNICACNKYEPSAQQKRDIPVKPIETADKAWGIPKKQAVCPNCDYYLGHVAFLDDYKGKRVTYCETCGQAIDWEGWDFDG